MAAVAFLGAFLVSFPTPALNYHDSILTRLPKIALGSCPVLIPVPVLALAPARVHAPDEIFNSHS